MSVILATVQFILIGIICLMEAKRKSSASFLWATLMIMFGVMHAYSALTGKSEYSAKILSEVSIFVIAFCLIYITVRYIMISLSGRHEVYIAYDTLSNIKSSQISYFVFIFIIVSVLLVWEQVSFVGGFLNTSWSSGRDFSATLDYANGHQILNILYFALGGIPLALWIQKKCRMSIFCILLISIVSIVTRNRILVLPLLVFLIAIVLLKIKNIKIEYVIFAIIAAVSVIYIVYGLRVFRHYGTVAEFLRDFNFYEFIDRINLYIATDNGELGLRNDFYFFVQNDNNFEAFGTGATYLRMLFVYFPTRFSFGLKPDDFAQAMGAAIGMVEGGSTHPTLFGDCYANLGEWGVILGAFWAVYCSIADKIVMKTKDQTLRILVYCLFAITFVIIGRGSVYNSFFFVAWGIPTLWGVAVIFRNIPKLKIKFKQVKSNEFKI